MKKIVVPFLLSFALIVFSHTSEAQQYSSWLRNLDTDSVDFVQDMVLSDDGYTYMALIRNGKGTTEVNGNAMLRKFDNEGANLWTTRFNGQGTISDLLFENERLYFAGHATSGIKVLNDTIPPGALFVGCMNTGGSIIWLRHADSLSGYYAKMALNSSGEVLVSTQAFFGKSYILSWNSSGQFVGSKSIPGLSISDITIDENDNLYLTGMAAQNAQIDTMEIRPPFATFKFPSFTLKINDQMVAVWIRYTKYVSNDHHHRIAYFDQEIVVFHRVADTGIQSNASLLSYAPNGQLTAHKYLKTLMSSPFVELSANDDNLYAIVDSWRFGSPGLPDTLRVSAFSSGLELTGSVGFASRFPIKFYSNPPFKIASDSCGFVFASVYNGDSIVADGDVLFPDYNGNNVCVAAMEICAGSGSFVADHTVKDLVVYPNPGPGVYQIQLRDSRLSGIRVLDIRGNEVFTRTGPSQVLDITGQPDGMYIVQLITEDGIRSVKVVKH